MSRIGKKKIEVPKGVTIEMKGETALISGPLGKETFAIFKGIELKMLDGTLSVVLDEADEGNKKQNAIHGLSRALLANIVYGVTKGFEKDLEIIGVGYRATAKGKGITFQLGYSHPVEFDPPEGITLEVLEPTKVRVKGINKQMVGQVAANIRSLRPPEPYKGKGIRYKGEYIKKKAGKAGKK